MKVTEQDIIRTARQLRDEENAQQNVRPFKGFHRQKRFAIPAWVVAIPAAAILGFVFGFWTKSNSQVDTPLTTHVDTVYIKVHNPVQGDLPLGITKSDAWHVQESPQPGASPNVRSRGFAIPASPKANNRGKRRSRGFAIPATGRPVTDDRIRYDLLVRN